MRVKKEGRNPRKSGLVMLGIVAGLYLVTFILSSGTGMRALASAWEIVKMIAPILLVVFFLMALLRNLFSTDYITTHLGKESGLKGWLIALGGGILSHGPAYVWYPMLSQMRKQGVKEGLIVAFFYARSIKVPWLPLMASYFGLCFTVLLSLFVLFAAWLQGMIAERLLR